jgi:CDP-glycerol glycerophosphotransferase (TagB/SpsB family)
MRIIRDSDLQSIGIQLYQLLAYSEALITDYSSVYFDYLLLDRPMATTLDDVDCWKKGNGFAFDLEKLYAETNESLYSLDDLFRFIDEVVIQGKDTHEEARLRMRDLTNIHKDGNSAKRVAGFIVERLKVS